MRHGQHHIPLPGMSCALWPSAARRTDIALSRINVSSCTPVAVRDGVARDAGASMAWVVAVLYCAAVRRRGGLGGSDALLVC